MDRGMVTLITVLLIILAALLALAAWNEVTFRAWTFGHTSMAALIAALVILKLYEIWRE